MVRGHTPTQQLHAAPMEDKVWVIVYWVGSVWWPLTLDLGDCGYALAARAGVAGSGGSVRTGQHAFNGKGSRRRCGGECRGHDTDRAAVYSALAAVYSAIARVQSAERWHYHGTPSSISPHFCYILLMDAKR